MPLQLPHIRIRRHLIPCSVRLWSTLIRFFVCSTVYWVLHRERSFVFLFVAEDEHDEDAGEDEHGDTADYGAGD